MGRYGLILFLMVGVRCASSAVFMGGEHFADESIVGRALNALLANDAFVEQLGTLSKERYRGRMPFERTVVSVLCAFHLKPEATMGIDPDAYERKIKKAYRHVKKQKLEVYTERFFNILENFANDGCRNKEAAVDRLGQAANKAVCGLQRDTVFWSLAQQASEEKPAVFNVKDQEDIWCQAVEPVFQERYSVWKGCLGIEIDQIERTAFLEKVRTMFFGWMLGENVPDEGDAVAYTEREKKRFYGFTLQFLKTIQWVKQKSLEAQNAQESTDSADSDASDTESAALGDAPACNEVK